MRVRDRLFAQGLQSFAKHGYAEVSVDEIVSAARTTKPMLYYYFGSKAGLYTAIAEEAFATLRAAHAAATAPELPALERLRGYVKAEFRTMRDNPDLARFIYRSAYAGAREAPAIDHWSLFLPSFTQVVAILEAGQAEGLVAAGAAPARALALFGLIGIYTQVHVSGAMGGMLDDESADALVDQFLWGAATRGP